MKGTVARKTDIPDATKITNLCMMISKSEENLRSHSSDGDR
jgi:hypothetical protein